MYRGRETERSIKGAVAVDKGNSTPRQKHSWRAQFIGLLIGLVVFAIIMITLLILGGGRVIK